MTSDHSTILVVDDNENNRELLTRRLGRHGYRTLTAEDGRQALALLAHQPIDLVLLDLMMPVMNGFQVLEQMRADTQLRHVPVVVISAINDTESVVQAIELGAVDYLPKPFNPTLLKARVCACLEKKRLHDLEQSRLAELALLQRIDRELNATLDLQRIMQMTLCWAVDQAAATSGWIGLIEADHLRVLATHGYADEMQLTGPCRVPADHPAVQAIISTTQPMPCPALLPAGGLLPDAAAQLCVPMLRDEQMIGLLFLERTTALPRADETLAFLGRLCDHAAIAVANALLHEAVQAANRAKSEFVSLVAHELRTPMTAIKGFTDLLERGGFGSITDQQHEWLHLIRSSLGTMIGLVSDLSDVSRIEAGQLRLECDVVSMPNVITEVAYTVQTQCDTRNQTLTVSLAPDLPPAWADRMRLSQILTNLLSNAHKYTPDGGQITVCVQLDQNVVGHEQEVLHVMVQDTGFGLSADDQQRVFQKFFRSSQQAVRDQPGTGLGLSITKHLVELQGGQIWFQSTHGVGTTFHFTVPLAPATALIDAMERY